MEKEEKRPVIFFDLETTGKDKDTNNIRIIQIAAYKYKDVENWELMGKLETKYNNGDKPIQPGAIEVHGITPEMVKDLPTFHDCAKDVFEFFDGCDLGGYNNSFFDNSVLYMSFLRAGIKWDYRKLKIYDVLNLYRKYHSSKLKDVYRYFYGCDFENAHDANADIIATIKVYQKMKELGEDFEGEELDFYKYNLDLIGDFKYRIEDGKKVPYYNFGAHKGETVEEVGVNYLEWMVKNGTRFPLDTINVAKQLIVWLERVNAEKAKEITDTRKWYE